MAGNGGTRSEFSWDDKYVGAQVLISKLVLEGKVGYTGTWAQCKSGRAIHLLMCSEGQLQCEENSRRPIAVSTVEQPSICLFCCFHCFSLFQVLVSSQFYHPVPKWVLRANDLTTFVKSQVDYILGSNPKQMSYMVGVGTNYPKEVHHRGASIVSIKASPAPVECKEGFTKWFNRNEPNPNVLDGAIVGGPDENDGYTDSRSNFQQAEPATVTIAPMVGVLANLA
ncbi:hypothetical protein Scep_005691 [Stephania cephalantha]|uniref:Endoglucanase n=1 Tax=Stephania cephalantha TaxID=152367 RepID=A0AAP0KUU3_9MAGN